MCYSSEKTQFHYITCYCDQCPKSWQTEIINVCNTILMNFKMTDKLFSVLQVEEGSDTFVLHLETAESQDYFPKELPPITATSDSIATTPNIVTVILKLLVFSNPVPEKKVTFQSGPIWNIPATLSEAEARVSNRTALYLVSLLFLLSRYFK